jgi:DNA-binding MarR family transcriptional regulator
MRYNQERSLAPRGAVYFISYHMKRLKQSPKALDLNRFVPYLVNVLASRLSREFADVYGTRFGISIPEWRVIAHLSQHKNVSVREVHERVDMDKAKVSRAAMRLEALGLIEKSDNERDHRLVALRLTKNGRSLFAEIEPLALGYERHFLSILSPKEERNLREIIEKLLHGKTVATDAKNSSNNLRSRRMR